MLRNGILQDTFGMLCFLRLIGLRINGRMLHFWGQNWHHYLWYIKEKAGVTQDRKKINPSKLLLRGLLETEGGCRHG